MGLNGTEDLLNVVAHFLSKRMAKVISSVPKQVSHTLFSAKVCKHKSCQHQACQWCQCGAGGVELDPGRPRRGGSSASSDLCKVEEDER